MSALFSVAGKCALVTGGNRGVGLMIARGLLQAGARVYISARDPEVCARSAAELSLWGDCRAIAADLSQTAECARLAQELGRQEDCLHILVNNAGQTLGAPLADFGDEQWDSVFDVNVKGVFQLTRHLHRLLEKGAAEGDPARVINIGSVDGFHVPAMENYSYTASKAALHHLTRHLAKRLGPNVTVNALALGPFISAMTDASIGADMAARAPLRRIGNDDDAAGAVIFLSARAGAFLTGAVIPVDGGLITTV
ncbi:SDR family oxidoreductase [Massilia sp. BJB1822]|uniref:SDR family oxidoreductase n=1 Tax=Massilia sp. BJB1822 TaxID=2744470 RepID=UPI0015932E6C|nr:SDR family oxidoreductase [Massilia sp. BJB1822]NVE00061.1 SDR family oxidoreductase [Massilia sp. BJB1822]